MYELDPKTFADYRYHENPVFYTVSKGFSWFIIFTVIVLVYTVVFSDIQQKASSFPLPYIISGVCSALLLGIYLWFSRNVYVRDIRRRAEAGVLRYVMDNNGVLYLKELPYYTRECYETAEPMISKWHQRNHCTISYSEDGGVIYRFPNYTRTSLVSDYEPDIDPIHTLFKFRTDLQLGCSYVFLFAVIGSSLLLAGCILIFYIAFAVILGFIIWVYLTARKGEAEVKERIALQVAEIKEGALTVYELAYNALMTMEEADNLLRKWERANIARKVEQGEDSAPLYMISGVVSMSERMKSEHV